MSSSRSEFIPLIVALRDSMLDGYITTPSGDLYRKATINGHYKNFIRKISEYQDSLDKVIYIEDIDITWAERFRQSLIQDRYSKNSIAQFVATLKSTLAHLYRQGVCKYSGTGIRAVSELTTTVYTTMSELRLLNSFHFAFPGHERVRDAYIVHCFVGLRIGDFFDFIFGDIRRFVRTENGRDFFELKTEKTGEVVFIPVSNIVKDVLIRRNYNFGKRFSQQHYNLTLRRIMKISGINQCIIHSITRGGERIDTEMGKSDLVSSHTARRSFATNAFLSGIPVPSIMKITGHRSVTSFMRYIRVGNLESALLIADHDFFKQKL